MKVEFGELVSVVIPTHNRRDLLPEAVDSVLGQTYDNIEVVIVDDASTDGTVGMLEERYSDRDNIRCIVNSENLGPGGARNAGVIYSTGNVIAFHDSDDIWTEHKLEKQMRLFSGASDDTAMVYCAMEKRQGACSMTVPDPRIPLEEKSGEKFLKSLMLRPFVGAPTMVMKKDCYTELGGFDPALKSLEDYDLSLRIALNYNILMVNESLYIQRLWEKGSVNSNDLSFVLSMAEILDRYYEEYKREGMLSDKLEYDFAVAVGRKRADEYIGKLVSLGKPEYLIFVREKLEKLKNS